LGEVFCCCCCCCFVVVVVVDDGDDDFDDVLYNSFTKTYPVCFSELFDTFAPFPDMETFRISFGRRGRR